MSMHFKLVAAQRKMTLYNNGRLLSEYPLYSSEVQLLQEAGATDRIGEDLVTPICGKEFIHLLYRAVSRGAGNSPDGCGDPLFDFPPEE